MPEICTCAKCRDIGAGDVVTSSDIDSLGTSRDSADSTNVDVVTGDEVSVTVFQLKVFSDMGTKCGLCFFDAEMETAGMGSILWEERG